MVAITTYSSFTTALAALSVTGVERRYTYPPTALSTADLPAQWPGLPSGNEPMLTFQTNGGWPEMTCDLIIAVEPVGQNTQSANYNSMITAIDNLSTALRGASIGRGPLTWNITGNVQIAVAGTTYWAVIATVTGY
jgi:hypothetical protein